MEHVHTDEQIKALAIEANREEFANTARDIRAMEGRITSSIRALFTGYEHRVATLESESKKALQSIPVIEAWMVNHDNYNKDNRAKFRFGAQQIYNLAVLFLMALSLTISYKVYEHSISFVPTAQAQTSGVK